MLLQDVNANRLPTDDQPVECIGRIKRPKGVCFWQRDMSLHGRPRGPAMEDVNLSLLDKRVLQVRDMQSRGRSPRLKTLKPLLRIYR